MEYTAFDVTGHKTTTIPYITFCFMRKIARQESSGLEMQVVGYVILVYQLSMLCNFIAHAYCTLSP